MLEPVSNKVNFSKQEEDILAFWQDEEIFERSLDQRSEDPHYVFYDGPPFATGLPHYGHLLAGTIKDIIPRYQTMRGFCVERRFGWDCHGLPIEALAQEALGLAGAQAIREIGVDVFNEKCRKMVDTYVEEWRRTVTRMGRWVDFENDYKTMDLNFMETIWWVFRQLWDQGRIYRSYRIMPYSWKLTTTLSNFEAGSNYKDVQDPSVTVRVLMKRTTEEIDSHGSVYALLWTTTPWTLPGNLAVAVGPDIEYVIIREGESGDCFLLAEARLAEYFPDETTYEILAVMPGAAMTDWSYEPLFPYFQDEPRAFRVLADDFVDTSDGTGLVHLAPAYGEDDFRVCRHEGIGLVDPLDENAVFGPRVPDFAGQFCKDADKDIIRYLKDRQRMVRHTTIVHSYPFCERTDTPLIYRAIEAWYVRVEDLREDLVAGNETVNWVPDYVGEKRFSNWLREAKDWNISRNRFWGSCLPVWVNEDDPDDTICVGSIAELEELSGVRVDDLHKHVVDKVVICRDGKTYRRTPEVLDCWFESGSMPLAQQHYPFERADELDNFFPADFIAEGLDQTRGWFYTLLVLSTALFGRSCYRNVIVNGLVLAADGRKMSKRLKNYPDPHHILDTYGADALRLYMMNSPVVRAEELCFSEAGVKHAMRHLLIPLWNAYSFFVTYATVDGWTPEARDAGDPVHVLDRWILSSLDHLTQEVVAAMDAYNLQRAVRPFVHFIEDLTNWYIRRSRRRFWKSSNDFDKLQAYSTLYEVLMRLCRIAAPFVPFISEAIYRNLRSPESPVSVHLCDFPVSDGKARDPVLEQQMQDVITVVQLGRKIRTEYEIRVRQPLEGLHVVCRDSERLANIQNLQGLIEEELNVKHVWTSDRENDLADFSAKLNFRSMGPRLGPLVKKVAAAVQGLPSETLCDVLEGGEATVTLEDGGAIVLKADDLVIERVPREGLAVAAEGELVVALEVNLSMELKREGLARELVNRIQNIRKEREFAVSQRIWVAVTGDEFLREAVEEHGTYIRTETLCAHLNWLGEYGEGMNKLDLNGVPCGVLIEKEGKRD